MKALKINVRYSERSDSAFNHYLLNVAKFPLMSPEEEVIVAREARLGDQRATRKLIEANLRFVVSVAKQYLNQGLPVSDLVNEGNIGLVLAAKKFDETKGFKFISYAVWWIRQSILMAIREDTRLIRLPINKLSILDKINEFSNVFEHEHFREPTDEEITEVFKIDKNLLPGLLSAYKRDYWSLDKPLTEDGEKTLLDVFPDDSVSDPSEEKFQTEQIVSVMKKTLKPVEFETICLYYGLDGNESRSLENIAESRGTTRERVRQIKDKALKRLKRVLA